VVTAATIAQTQTGFVSTPNDIVFLYECFIHGGKDKESNVKFSEHLFITVIILWQV
jgi:hypothetical protein